MRFPDPSYLDLGFPHLRVSIFQICCLLGSVSGQALLLGLPQQQILAGQETIRASTLKDKFDKELDQQAPVLAVAEDRLVQFSRDIRPILSSNCYFCHGPDEETREADLRLDDAHEALADRGGYRAITAGDPEQSEVWSRIASRDPDAQMPPSDSNKKLTDREKLLIREWILQGAPWQGHWSFIAPTRPVVPKQGLSKQGLSKLGQSGQDDRWVRNPIDAFVLDRIHAEKLAPSEEADRRTLARRLAFDLTGLPASADEVEAFVATDGEAAYQHLVDRLLASPHHGERMALNWLDLVRYADTNGIHGDNPRPHAPYRDYVIRAFNDNMPFDRFTIEQLAGDLVPGATAQQKIASGYNRLDMTTREGGAQPKEYMAKYAADRVRNVASVWLGVTMGCCECHDHKFDPLKTREFYELAAFFADLEEVPVGVQPPVYLPTGEAAARLAKLQSQRKDLEASLHAPTAEMAAAQADWETTVHVDRTPWAILRAEPTMSEQGSVLKVGQDGSLLSTGVQNPPTDIYNLNLQTDLAGITAIRLEALPDKRLPAEGPGRAPNGNFVLRELEISINGQSVHMENATATYSQPGWPVTAAIDGKAGTGWAVMGRAAEASVAIFRLAEPITGGPGTTFQVRMEQNHGEAHTLGRFRFAVTNLSDPPTADLFDRLPVAIVDILRLPPASRSDKQREQLASHFRRVTPLLEKDRRKLGQLQRAIDQINQDAAILISKSGPPREVRVLPKGNWLDESGSVVLPGVPECLPPLNVGDRRATRLDLARWLVRPDHPLVARVLVNRWWQMLFGRGLVTSVADFGAQGTWPSHPRLLDWLAVELIDSGWNMKHVVRLIVTSSTYRQSSWADASLRQHDSDNRWLARQGRFRLSAELVRDNGLAVSGLLNRAIGGPSVKPYQPAGYWQHLNFPRRVYQADSGTGPYRRGLYTHWQRTFLNPSLQAFDAPSREECTARRARSNTPLQALVLLNDPTYVEAARALAEIMHRQGEGNPERTVQAGYRRILARVATDDEVDLLARLYQQHWQAYQADLGAAEKLLQVGNAPLPTEVEVAELAAWTSVARVLLNLHETITRY